MRRERMPLLMLSIAALLVAMWAGLMRIGWRLDALQPSWPLLHGPLMVSAFLGTLIGVERAVALGQRWVYIGPLLTALGGVVLFAGGVLYVGQFLLFIGSVLIVYLFRHILQRQSLLAVWVMALGSGLWALGNGLWLMGYPLSLVTLWWIGYLAFTIVGERIELARILALQSRILRPLYGVLALYILGLAVAFVDFAWGVRVVGGSLVGMSLWLSRYDIARRTVKQAGLPRFVAYSLLTGYVWMGVAGVLALVFGNVVAGPHYDAWLHAFFLGFVFSMIFGHAPIIFPSVLGLPVTFHPAFYLHLGLLHVSLALRVVGDLLTNTGMRRWGGMLNVIAILLFLGLTATAVIRGKLSGSPEV